MTSPLRQPLTAESHAESGAESDDRRAKALEESSGSVLMALLRAMRPHQWVKNVFVLAALVFARGEQIAQGRLDSNLVDVWRTLLALAAFCLSASAIYLVNDIVDVESDRAHPEKCRRPIAAGEITLPFAWSAALLCGLLAFVLAYLAGGNGKEPLAIVAVVAGYVALNLAYSFWLKRVVLVDAFCIAMGFLLRVKAGGLAAHYYVSHWLMLCTLFLALFLALCKRRAEIDLLGEGRANHRKILQEYTRGFLDQVVTILAATTIVCYTMYTVAEETREKFGANKLIYTVPFVVFGLARYLLLVQTQKGGGSPTRVLLGGDWMFLANALLWALSVGIILYG